MLHPIFFFHQQQSRARETFKIILEALQSSKMANYYEHYQIPYDSNQVNNLYDHNYYDSNQHQQFGSYPMSYNSGYDPMSYNSYDPMSYNSGYDNWNGSSEYETASAASVAYSVSTMSEPKHLFYDPNVYTTYESPPQFNIHRNVQGGFNEPEFEEYDPTPYGGGYDIVATYGKPLPPSVKICYPSSSSTVAQGNPPSPPEVIAPVPLGVYDGGEVKAVYVPSGYGLEATDMCEVIFGGYFPCVLRNKRRQEEDQNRAAEVSCWDSNDSDPWKTTSDYLFGDLYPYGYENRLERSQFEISSYGYQRYY
ncbi:glycine-rich protein [Raphanus sativus]|nr:glycine-rich protein [Raphanus sativus]